MLIYRPAAFRPPAPSPALGQAAALGRTHFLGQTFDQLLDFSPAMGDVIRLAFHTTSAYLGIWVGLKEEGGLKYLGWVLGVGQAVGAVCDAISLTKRITGTHPAEGSSNPICDYMAPTGLPMAPRFPVAKPMTVENSIP